MKTAYISTIPKIEAVQLEYMSPDSRSGKEWDSLVAASTTSGFRQSMPWAHLQAQLGSRVIHVGLFQRGSLVGGAIGYLSGKPNGTEIPRIVIPEGPVLDWLDDAHSAESIDKITTLLQDKATKLGAAGIRIAPRVTPHVMHLLRDFSPVSDNSLPRQTMCLDLRNNSQQLFAAMQPEARYNVQLARKNLSVKEYESSEALQWFYSMLKDAGNRDEGARPFGDWGKSPSPGGAQCCPALPHLTTMCDTLCSSGMAKIYVARHNGAVLAAALMIKFGQRATLLYAAAAQDHECATMAGYGLLWNMIERSRLMGCKIFDLNGFGEQAQACNLAPLTRQFNGNMMRFVGAWDFQFSKFVRLIYSA